MSFEPDPAPGDPYPVPADDWGRRRFTDYFRYAINRSPALSSPGAPRWLEARSLTFADIGADIIGRPAPEGWLERLHDLTERGLRAEQPGER